MAQPGESALTAQALSQQIIEMSLAGASFEAVLATFAEGLEQLGTPLRRLHVTARTLHPEFGGIAHRWLRETGTHQETFVRRSTPAENWVQSPFYYLLQQNTDEFRQRLAGPSPEMSFPFLQELRDLGYTDYVLFKRFFGPWDCSLAVDPNAPPEGCLVSLATDRSDGFTEAGLNVVRLVLPAVLLALRSASNRKMTDDVTTTYLGRDAGKRVLSGDIVRGSVRSIDAVICYFDLAGFTKLSEALPSDEVVALLNDYFGVVVEAIQEEGGNVLKFMGDGLLAIFDRAVVDDTDFRAIETALTLRERVAQVNARRGAEGLATTHFTLALHGGEVLYGNIGGKNRLDFTVIGPAVNTAARLSGMCAHVDQHIVISAGVANPCLDRCPALVSLGQYRLRGVAERQEIYTLD